VGVFALFYTGTHMTAMQLTAILTELQRRNNWDQSDLARQLKVTQPTVSRWYKGSAIKLQHRDRLIALAKKHGIAEAEMSGHTPTVPLVGYVGAGGQVAYAEGQGPFGEVPMPPIEAGSDIVAVVVRGDSMAGQLEDGWTVYYDNRRDPPTSELFNKLCVVGLADGRVLVKKLVPGTGSGRFHLFSSNASPLLDEQVQWAARVSWIAPK
jgi:predicted XRE-type DNA-binding protein